jgi:hypothetical protein
MLSCSCHFIYLCLSLQRFHYVDRISTAIDDYAHRSKSLSVEGWGCPRVDINMAELRSQDNGNLSQRLRRDPLPHLRALEAACHEIASEARPGYDKHGKFRVWAIVWLTALYVRFKLTKLLPSCTHLQWCVCRCENQGGIVWSRGSCPYEPS